MTAAVAALVAGLVTLLASPVIIRILVRAQRFDHPNARSSHSTPTPRGGGLAVLLGLGSVAAWALAVDAWSTSVWAAVSGTVALAAVGLIDDVKGLPPVHRLGAQVAVGIATGAQFDGLRGAVLGAMVIPAAVNMVNFMDGINGISAGHAALWGAAAWFAANVTGAGPAIATLGAISLGGALGFLPYNVPRARLFLGDVGSYLFGGLAGIGVLLAVTSVMSGAVAAPWTLLGVVCAPYALFAADTGTTLLRRLRAGEAVFAAHRAHVYQRLVNDGRLPHWAVSLATVCASFGVCAVAAVHPAYGLVASAVAISAYLSAPRIMLEKQAA